MGKIKKCCLVALALFAGIAPAVAQTEAQDLYELSLEELLNVSIVSASKEKERLFDAPVAAYTITRDEISKAGAWSIPEALRLVPGAVVRETSNGNYDIHLRGLDNTAKYGGGTNQLNTLTLVMINNRPVFNYNLGGTAWDALPIDLADVERIEVVCGPSAPLFGPNAVTGVINIITREFKQQEMLVSGQLQGSLPNGSINSSLAAGKQLSSTLSVGVSGNYQKGMRLDDQSYMYAMPLAGIPAMYMNTSEYVKAASDNEVDTEVSLLRKGLNAYATYNPSDNISFDFSSGAQHAQSQKILLTPGTPLSFSETSSYYANLNSKIHDLTLRSSFLKGEDDLNRLSEFYSSAYDFQVVDLAADYELKLHNSLRIRPSLGFQATRYNDLEQRKEYVLGGSLNGDHRMNNYSASLRADFTPITGLRIISSGRVDRFDVNKDFNLSYQFATTYALTERLLLRAVHGKSYSGMFYINAFSNTAYPIDEANSLKAIPNKDLTPSSNTLTEVGVRAQLLSGLQLDVTLFTQKLEDVSTHQISGYEKQGEVNIVVVQPNLIPYHARQHGVTASLNWIPSKQVQFRPFVTWQYTELRNFDYYGKPGYWGLPYEGKTVKHENTPAFYGGWYLNYAPFEKFNFNTSTYFFAEHTMSAMQDYPVQYAEGTIETKILLNARASYQVYNKLGLFIGGKNLLNKNTREYYGTDRMGSQYFAGVTYNL